MVARDETAIEVQRRKWILMADEISFCKMPLGRCVPPLVVVVAVAAGGGGWAPTGARLQVDAIHQIVGVI